MRRGLLVVIFSAALLCVIAQPASAKPLLHETVTLHLSDGTTLVCVLDDAGAQWVAHPGTSPKMKQAKFDFLSMVGKAESDFGKREEEYQKHWGWWERWPYKPDSTSDEKSDDTMTTFLHANVDHGKNKFLWGALVSRMTTKKYYYLPPSPKISIDAQGKPQFLFIKFVTDASEQQGGASGGILHFLAEYGLTSKQEAEAKLLLKEKVFNAELMGALPMQAGNEEASFRIISATLSDAGFTRNIVASGSAPLMAGQRVAVAARLDHLGATLLAKTLEKSTSDLTVEFNMAYTAFLPAFDGTIHYDWEKFKSNIDAIEAKYTKKWGGFCLLFCKKKETYTTEQMREIHDMLCQEQIVTIQWVEGLVDERLEIVRQSFLDLTEKIFFNKTQSFSADVDAGDDDDDELTLRERGRRSELFRFTAKSEDAFVSKIYRLRTQLPVSVPYTTTGNISGAWYLQAKNSRPDLFDEINLDDPFFQRRRIVFNLDLDAVEIFDDAINHVSVDVRKRRKSGEDFTDSLHIDKEWVEKHGVSASVQYAKMREADPGSYEYLVRWSLRGARDYPANPRWQRGEWEGVTLAPPIKPLTVEAEADLEELREHDIVRATVQFRYTKFGKPYEDLKSLHLSVEKNEPIQSKRIFRDTAQPSFDYKVIFYHKKKGRLDQGWQRGTEDGYVFCALPESLRKTLVDELTETLEKQLEKKLEQELDR